MHFYTYWLKCDGDVDVGNQALAIIYVEVVHK